MTTDWNMKLRGIIPPMISPLLDRDTLHIEGLERLIEHILAGGVHGLFVLGTTGEGPHLGYSLRRELVSVAVQQVKGRVPVLVGISDTSYAESVELARFSADAGADAVVVSVPYYFQAAQEELFHYIKQLARDAPLPLLLYNIPQMTKVGFAVETIQRALDLRNVVGIKDSSQDMVYFRKLREIVARYPGTSLFMGAEDLLAEALRLGAHGGVPGGANVFPRLFVELYDACQNDDRTSVVALHENIMQINSLLYTVGLGDAAALKSIKCALSHLGICRDYVALPLRVFSETQKHLVHERLEQIARLQHDCIRCVLERRLNADGADAAAKHVVHTPGDDANGSFAEGDKAHTVRTSLPHFRPSPAKSAEGHHDNESIR